MEIKPKKAVHGVETRWWSTDSMTDRAGYLRSAIKLQVQLGKIASSLSPTDWNVLELLLSVLDPFMYIQKRVTTNRVTATLFVSRI